MKNRILVGKLHHILALWLVSACSVNVGAVPCQTDQNCGLQAGGICAPGPSSDSWCQYPDDTCPSGSRWSDFGTGDGLSGACVVNEPGSEWVNGFGGPETDQATTLELDDADNILVAGSFSGTARFGGEPFTATMKDIVIAKYAITGAHVWSSSWGGPEWDWGTIAANSEDVFMTGLFSNTANFGGSLLSSDGDMDMVLARYGAVLGNHIWSKRIGANLRDQGIAVRSNSAGDVYALGFFEGPVDLGSGTSVTATSTDAFLAKFRRSDGLYVWGTVFPDAGDVRNVPILFGMGVLPNDDVILVGVGAQPGLVIKRLSAATGLEQWSQEFGTTAGVAWAPTVDIDASGNIILGGSFQGSIDFNNKTLTTAGANSEAFVAKLVGDSGAHIWSTAFGRSGRDSLSALDFDENENVVVAGVFRGMQDFGGTVLSSFEDSEDVFVAKYTRDSGQLMWARRYGGPGAEAASGVAVDSGGGVVLAGHFEDTVDFGIRTLTSNGLQDIFLLRFFP